MSKIKTDITRRVDWEDRLLAYLSDCRFATHHWGKMDCLMFVAGAIDAMTGDDPAKDHRGRYRTEKGAARYLKRLGFNSPEDYLNAHFEAIPPATAKRGDLVMYEDCAGICMGTIGVFVAEDNKKNGFERITFDRWQSAWKIG